MSSPTNRATSHGRAHHVITFLFTLSVVVFLLAGLAIVVGQAVFLVGGDATGARAWQAALVPFAFGGASVAGLLAFALTYWHGEDEDGLDQEDELQPAMSEADTPTAPPGGTQS
jgi:hypothetical protein